MGSLSEQDRTFVTQMREGSLIHLELDELAHRHAKTDEVRTVAGELFHHHKRMNEAFRELADRKGIEVSAELAGEDKDVLLELTRRSAEQFDQFYLERILDYSTREISRFRDETKRGEDEDLKNFARDQLPSLEEQLRIVRNLVSAGVE